VSSTNILVAAIDRLEAFVYAPQPHILWPGRQETPPNTGMWLQPKMFGNEPNDIAWDNDGCVDTRGFFQILVYFRPGQGQIAPSELADALIAWFPKGLDLGPVRSKQTAVAVTDDHRGRKQVVHPCDGFV